MLALLDTLAPAMREAGRLIEAIRLSGCAAAEKADKSPVTEADQQAEVLLAAAIRAVDTGAQIVGEEECAECGGVPEAASRFWLIDPLDGTKSFIAGSDDYSVNVGLVVDGDPVLGLLLAPRTGVLWAGVVGHGAWREVPSQGREPIATHRPARERPVVLTSRSHRDKRTEAWIADLPGGAEVLPSGSSLKFVALAEGRADLYPRFSPTSEWDTAAGDAILRAAGGTTLCEGREPFRYGKPGCRNAGFLAVGDPAIVSALPPLLAGAEG
ncbi:MAG: 3'(2'),5'-bisphosphate nucleotidase CysQ [Sphingomonadaceae bacterium]|nr:3'(2'),5'-bisphosphate nucleotidase CysQ [Sphingomonadaceae bacterium]